MILSKAHLLMIVLGTGLLACSQEQKKNISSEVASEKAGEASCHSNMPARFATAVVNTSSVQPGKASHAGMVRIEGGEFVMGSSDKAARTDEYPRHSVIIDSFWMDATEVTNAQFAEFVKATGYVTTAEKAPDWEELKKQLPPGTPKPDESVLVAASLVFTPPVHPVSLNDASQWWRWEKGANWRQPEGPGSNLKRREHYPVVHISWDDATAYATWAGKRLPTEAEWEFAARAGMEDQPYTWGSEAVEQGKPKANTWQGSFPDKNTGWDKFSSLAPVKSFAPNKYGLYDMAGNVWEWCADWYRPDYYKQQAGKTTANPSGPTDSYDPDEPTIAKRVTRGGSYLCNDSYCSGYRVSARMKSAPDTGLQNTGFRCVVDAS